MMGNDLWNSPLTPQPGFFEDNPGQTLRGLFTLGKEAQKSY
jgi:hypothetical protein